MAWLPHLVAGERLTFSRQVETKRELTTFFLSHLLRILPTVGSNVTARPGSMRLVPDLPDAVFFGAWIPPKNAISGGLRA